MALSLRSGGFFPDATALAAIVVLVALLLRATLARAPFAGLGLPAAVAGGALFAFGIWTLASSGWSHAPARALLSYERVLLYGSTLVLFATLRRDNARARTLLLGLTAAAVVVCVASLATWLAPDTFPIGPGFGRGRLAWPLSYWNATGLLAALGIVGCVHLACDAEGRAVVRVTGAAGAPILVAVLYFTASRGALAAVAVGVLADLVMARPVLALTGLPPVLLGALGAVLASNAADGLARESVSAAALSQGRRTALVLAGCVVGAAVLRLLALRVDRRLLRGRLRSPPLGGTVAALTACVAIAAGAFLAVEGTGPVTRAYSAFISTHEVPSHLRPSQRFTEVANNGRLAHWRVALRHGFSPHPWDGSGSGTFQLLWARYRPTTATVLNAHSLYVEQLGELGLPGLVLLLAAILTMLGALAVAAARRAGVWPALFAVTLAWALHAGVDWDWEMPAITLWAFAAAGLALGTGGRPDMTARGRRPVAIGVGLACLLLAITPALVVRSQTRLIAGVHALQRGDCGEAVDAALDSNSAITARPEPYELLAYCDVRAGRDDLARQAIDNAVRRDPDDWEFRYGQALVRAATGLDPRPAAHAALRLNPLSDDARAVVGLFATGDQRAWRRRALAAPLLLGTRSP